jgi:hypothetical protein
MSLIDTSDHRPSHRRLLSNPHGAEPQAAIDAIIVPTIRPTSYLSHAASLAKRLGCPLVALCSGPWTSAQAARTVADSEIIGLDIAGSGPLNLPTLQTSRVLRPRFRRDNDTAAKRNLGLTLAHLLGWQRIAFLDDDIKVGDPDHLGQAAGLLGRYSAVGLSIGGFPDNSVVCHAFRAVGGPQDAFVGGGALVVEVARATSFFPDLYNDDWFYLLEDDGLREVAVMGEATQSPYDPYDSPERARSEEFGDVLAEGLFWLVEEGKKLNEATERHWSEFLVRRGRLIDLIVARLDEVDAARERRMRASLLAARGQLAHITPQLCAAYVEAWRVDRETWRRHLSDLPTGLPLEAALSQLAPLPR